MKNNNSNRADLLKNFIQLVEETGITAYELEKNTGFSAVGIQKIIDGKTKRPQEHTLQTVISYIKSKPNLRKDVKDILAISYISTNKDRIKESEKLLNDIDKEISVIENMKTTDAFEEKLRLFKLKYEVQDLLDKLNK